MRIKNDASCEEETKKQKEEQRENEQQEKKTKSVNAHHQWYSVRRSKNAT